MKSFLVLFEALIILSLPMCGQPDKTGEDSRCMVVTSDAVELGMEKALGFSASNGNPVQHVICPQLKWYSFTLDKSVNPNTILVRSDVTDNKLQYAHALLFLYLGRTDVTDNLRISMQAETDADVGAAALFAGAQSGNCAAVNNAIDDRITFLRRTHYYPSAGMQTMVDALKLRRSEAEQLCHRWFDGGGQVMRGDSSVGCDNPICIYEQIVQVMQRRCVTVADRASSLCWLLSDTAERLLKEFPRR
jgi:hypothetical protein